MVKYKNKTPRKRKKLSEEERKQRAEQRAYRKEIVDVLKNIGFRTMPRINGVEFKYEGRTGELDNIFINENIFLIVEDTIERKPKDHLMKKKIIFDLINENHAKFIKFLMECGKFEGLKEYLENNVLNKYSIKQIQTRIIYASKYNIPSEHKDILRGIYYLDYPILKYFNGITKIIKSSSKYEFYNFLSIEDKNIGENIINTNTSSRDEFVGHILPEEHSSFDFGYKLVSFYIDAESLLKRALVLRKDGWKSNKNIGFYQRMLDQKKIKNMRKYLNDENRVFINNIIATIPVNEITLYDSKKNKLEINDLGDITSKDITKIEPIFIEIKNKTNIIGIIDGQHRVYAYHEGRDEYEEKIAKLRKIQNLLLTAIIFPKEKTEEERVTFEARLFLEINSTQQSAKSELKQAIELSLNPLSVTSISQDVLNRLNESGPLAGLFSTYFYERDKIKTASIVSFGLRPLLKLDGNDSLYHMWSHKNKEKLKNKLKEKKPKITADDYELLEEYRKFCTEQLRNLIIAFKDNISNNKWDVRKRNTPNLLNVTFINGMIHCMRSLIENNKTGSLEYYRQKLKGIDSFQFNSYKASHYRKMGKDIYSKFFS